MAKVAAFSPESPNDPAHTTILHSTEDERNVSQIGMLLQIREQSGQFLAHQEQIGSPWTVDAEAVDDARKTFTLAGIRLRDLLDEQKRWTLDPNAIDIKTAAVLDLKIRDASSMMKLRERVQAPSAVYKTQLRKIELRPGKLVWVCWLGGLEPTHFDCHGMGDTPQEAMKAFDDAFMVSIQQPLPPEPAAPPVVNVHENVNAPVSASKKKPRKKK